MRYDVLRYDNIIIYNKRGEFMSKYLKKPASRYLFLAIFITILVCFSGTASAATLEVGTGQTYATIGSAVTAAGTNDVINVHSGTYAENVVIGKSNLTLQANTGDTVTVQTTGSNTGFQINSANYVTIQGFNMQNTNLGGYAVYLNTASFCSILNNNINTYSTAIYIKGSNNTISGNNINNTMTGVSLVYPSNNNTMSGNTITNPTYNSLSQVRLGMREDYLYDPFGGNKYNVGNQYLNNIINKVNEGIFISQGSSITISGNRITIEDTYNYPWAITVQLGNTANQVNVISNNILTAVGKTNGGGRGMYLITNPTSPSNASMQIYGNDISNFLDGIIGILYTPSGATSSLQIYLNRFYNNTRQLGMDRAATTLTMTAVNNWFGKNDGLVVSTSASQPGSYDIWYNQGTMTYNPWIKLNVSASPTSIVPGGSSTVTADLNHNSNGQDVTILYPGKYMPNGIPVTFAGGALGTVLPISATTTNGVATTTFTAGMGGGTAHPTAIVDATTVQTDINIAGPPSVTNWNPATGAVNVPADQVIQVTFDKDVVLGAGTIELKDLNMNVIPVTIGLVGNLLTITPNSPLLESLYTIYLNTDCVRDASNNPLAATSSTFSVGNSPNVTTWDPATGAVNVPANKVIQVTFDENVVAGSGLIELWDNLGNPIPINTSILGNILTITPQSLLVEGIYDIFLNDGAVTDLAGNPLAFTSSFFTSGAAPVVTNWDPASNAVNVPSDKVINITFNKDIYVGTNFIELLNKAGAVIPINTSILGNVLTITPLSPLAESKYTIILHTGCVTDILGNKVANTNSKFSVGASPVVTTWNPASGATNIAGNTQIIVTFNESITKGNMFIELLNKSGAVIPITTSVSGNILKIIPVSTLAENKYTVILHTGCVTDLAGNPVANISSKFSVGTSPTVTTWDPANGATNVSRSKQITITFSENITKGTQFIELKNSTGTVIPVTISYGTNKVIIKPNSTLAANTKYTVYLHTGCVTDIAGNPVAATSSKFTTGA
jgi:methionine-rich copper-binding protein CopC